jgi:hypothetical protein
MPVSALELQKTIAAAASIKSGALRLWGQWFGHPHDNFHKISGCLAFGDLLAVNFDDGGKLTVQNPQHWRICPDIFEIQDADSVLWEWYYYGRPRIPNNLYYIEYKRGVLGIEAKSNVDWYIPEFNLNSAEYAVQIL